MNINIEITKEEKEMLKQYADMWAYYDNFNDAIYTCKKEMLDGLNHLSYDEVLDIIDDLEVNDEYDCLEKNISLRLVHYIKKYKDVAYFLTRAEAEKYVEYQKHNLYNPRIFTYNAGYSNNGDYVVLTKLLKRIGEQIK